MNKTTHNNQMQRRVVIIALLLIPILTMCSPKENIPGEPTTVVETTAYVSTNFSSTITANGIIQPVGIYDLGFGSAGPIQLINVSVGESVQAGDILASLHTEEAILALENAELELSAAQAAYDQAEASAITIEQAAMAEAKAALITAQLEMNDLIERAESEFLQAEAQYTLHTSGIRLEELLTEQGNITTQRCSESKIDTLYADYLLARDQYQQIQENFDTNYAWKSEDDLSRAAAMSKLSAARDVFTHAQANLNYCQGQPDEDEISDLEAQIQMAQAVYDEAQKSWDEIKDGEPDPDLLALVEAELTRAEAQLLIVTTQNSAAVQLALAQSRLDAAQLNVKSAQLQLEKSVIKAPVDGSISAITFQSSEWVSPGQPVIQLIDDSAWQVETRNVGELEIGKILIGGTANVIVNAFSDQQMAGIVAEIHPTAIVQQGDVTYTLIIKLEESPLDLRSGMTARVEIKIGD